MQHHLCNHHLDRGIDVLRLTRLLDSSATVVLVDASPQAASLATAVVDIGWAAAESGARRFAPCADLCAGP